MSSGVEVVPAVALAPVVAVLAAPVAAAAGAVVVAGVAVYGAYLGAKELGHFMSLVGKDVAGEVSEIVRAVKEENETARKAGQLYSESVSKNKESLDQYIASIKKFLFSTDFPLCNKDIEKLIDSAANPKEAAEALLEIVAKLDKIQKNLKSYFDLCEKLGIKPELSLKDVIDAVKNNKNDISAIEKALSKFDTQVIEAMEKVRDQFATNYEEITGESFDIIYDERNLLSIIFRNEIDQLLSTSDIQEVRDLKNKLDSENIYTAIIAEFLRLYSIESATKHDKEILALYHEAYRVFNEKDHDGKPLYNYLEKSKMLLELFNSLEGVKEQINQDNQGIITKIKQFVSIMEKVYAITSTYDFAEERVIFNEKDPEGSIENAQKALDKVTHLAEAVEKQKTFRDNMIELGYQEIISMRRTTVMADGTIEFETGYLTDTGVIIFRTHENKDFPDSYLCEGVNIEGVLEPTDEEVKYTQETCCKQKRKMLSGLVKEDGFDELDIIEPDDDTAHMRYRLPDNVIEEIITLRGTRDTSIGTKKKKYLD